MLEEIIETGRAVGFLRVAVNKTKPDLGGAMLFDGVVKDGFDVMRVSAHVEMSVLGKNVPVDGTEAALVLPDYVPRLVVATPYLCLHPLPHMIIGLGAVPQMPPFDLRVQILHNVLCHARTPPVLQFQNGLLRLTGEPSVFHRHVIQPFCADWHLSRVWAIFHPFNSNTSQTPLLLQDKIAK